jgi:midasin
MATGDYKMQLSLITSAMQATPSPYMAAAWSQHISPIVNVIENSDELTSQHIGQLWLAICWTLLDLYVPNIPIDPAVEQNMQRQAYDHRSQRLHEELQVWQQATKEIIGTDSTPAILSIEQDLETVKVEIRKLPPAPRARVTENSVINTFFSETYQFLQDVFSQDRLRDLTQVLEGSGSHSQGIAREEALQHASSAFLTRLQSRYADIRDLARPVALAVRHGQIGLSLLSQAARLGAERGREEIQMLANALVAFPTVKGSNLLQSHRLQGSSGLGSASSLLMSLSAHGYAASIGQHMDTQITAISEIYERLSLLAERDQKRKAAETQEAESLYRQRKTEEEVLSDLELEAKEMAELFPTYEDPDMEDSTPASPVSDSKTLITDEDLRAAYQTHMLLYGRSADVSLTSDFAQRRDSQVAKVLEVSIQSLDEKLDMSSLPYQVQRLTRGSLAFSNTTSDHRNFYTSANKGEANRALVLLSSLALRLRGIQEEWPDQMVLQHILDRCSSIMQMSAESPVARFLPAMEQLLEHTEDWENFANKDNSISKHRRDIIDLIVSWRRQELQYWSVLLRQHIEAFELEIAPWWIKLYRLLISGPMSLVQSAYTDPDAPSVNRHLEEATKLLIEFMQGSQLGHFIPRLRLLQAFQTYVQMLGRSENNSSLSDLWKAVSLIILNVRRQFMQYESVISTHFQKGRAALEKSIQDYIKLASWKDINVQALRASAKKTHGQLFKMVRKLRELLKEPVSPLLAQSLPPVSTDAALDAVATVVGVSSIGIDLGPSIDNRNKMGPVAKPLASLETTVARFAAVLGSVEPDVVAEMHLTLEDLSSDIVSTVKQLGDETPSNLTEENAKFLRNLELRKRKALSELLKALRALGFSAKVPATQLLKQQTLLFLHQLADMPRKAGSRLLVERVDEYHNRLHSILPNMRAGLASHSDDIATPDLARAHGFAESVFAAALSSRER